MPIWLQLASGPLMRFTLAILVLGLTRLVVLTIWDLVSALGRARDKQIPIRTIFTNTIAWLLPIKRLARSKPLYSYASFFFHMGILMAGFFLSNHMDILKRVTGIQWITINKPVLDLLTLVIILCGTYLLFYRVYSIYSRQLTSSLDYLLLILLISIAITGFVAGQTWNPIPYDVLMLSHTLMGGTILLLTPFTKISHCVLFPLIRLSSEVAWHFAPDSARQVANNLHGSEVRKI